MLKKFFIEKIKNFPFDYLSPTDLIKLELFNSHASLAYSRREYNLPKFIKKDGRIYYHRDDVIDYVENKYS